MAYVAIFASVTLGSLLVFQAATRYWHPDRARARRRVAEAFGGEAGGAPSQLYRNLDTLTFDLGAEDDEATAAPAGASGRPRERLGVRDRFEAVIREAGIALTAPQALGVILAAASVVAVPGAWFGGVLGGILGATAGAAGPIVVVGVRRRARRERYLKQLSGAFELMARVLRTGQSVSEAFRAVVDSFDDPVAGEFAACLHQIELGLRPEAAYQDLGQRTSVLELRIFVVAMAIQRQTGGNMSELLDRLSALVRARVRTRQKIRSLTAEGRLQSTALVVLPFVTFAAMYFLNRQYASLLLGHGNLLLATAACMGVGIVWIRNVVNFEG